jgi:prepilin-type N-terminal cleavage/methylation domain-containing protein
MKRKLRRSGFTLVEMLVAVALVLFIMSIFAMLMQSAMQGVRDAKGINAVDQKLRNAVTLMKADLRQVYLANGGTRFSPAELFTRRDRIPTAGYFSIYENSRALPQGVDEYGNQITVDYDDILAMTVARRGDSASEMFYGRANTYVDNLPATPYGKVTVNGTAKVDVGTYLDNLWSSPSSRFDVPSNQMLTSKFAEVIYFARPQGETPTLHEIVGDPWAFGNTGGLNSQSLPVQPRTFTLYRRQLLVLDDDAMNRPPANGRGVGPVLIPGSNGAPGVSPYNALDVSMSRELVLNGGGVELAQFDNNGVPAASGGFNALHFNSLSDLTRREMRYGMQPVIVALPTPFDQDPYRYNPGTHIYGFNRTLRAYPLSHVDSTAAAANPLPILHDYYSSRGPTERLAPSTAALGGGGPASTKLETWIGFPTLSESGHPAFPFWMPTPLDAPYPPTLPPNPPGAGYVNMTVDPATGELSAYPVGTQRAGEDVLLRDVLSFNIGVLEDLGGYRGLMPDGTDDPRGMALQAPSAGGETEYHDLVAGGPLYGSPAFPAADANVFNVMGRRPQFVDLGYGADQDNYNTPTGGDDAAAATVNVLTLSNYLFQSPPPPTPPASFTLNGVTYTYGASPYNTATMSLTAFPFTHVWPPSTPVSLGLTGLPAPADTALRRGAYSPVGAPFGVPLDAKFWLGGSVNDQKQSDVYFGPDGKPGIAGFADIAPHNGSPDTGVLNTDPPSAPATSWGPVSGEYFGTAGGTALANGTMGRSDDLPIDFSFTVTTPPAPWTTFGANTFFYERPGIFGPDFGLGERGKIDDYYAPPGVYPDLRDKPAPETGTQTQYSLGELFAAGSDDNPFVGIPFKLSGQVAAINNTVSAKHHPFNLYNLNPRNTYDSWSGSGDLVYQYNGTAPPVSPHTTLPGYKSSPVRLERMFPLTPAGYPPQAHERSYIPEPDFRPVPYPRPVKAVQVKIRVLERRTGIVRDATIRHFFTSGTD